VRPPDISELTDLTRHARLSPALQATLTPSELAEYREGLARLEAEMRDHREFLRTVNHQLPNLLMRMALIYRVALFDAFLSDVQRIVLTARPELLKNDDRKLTYAQIIDQTLENRLIESMAESTVTSIDRHSSDEQFAKIRNRLQIGFNPDETVQKQLTEIIARRNVFTHANGIVNSAYLNLVPDSPFPRGTQLEVDYQYWIDGHDLLRTICTRLLEAILARHCN
jgi:hypothetical protein